MTDRLPSTMQEPGLVPGADPTSLTPEEPFPEELLGLSLVQLQVLHSRVSRRLEQEYLSLEGPHPLTVDRLQCLGVELDSRVLTDTTAASSTLTEN